VFSLSKFERIWFPFPDFHSNKLLRAHGYRKKNEIRPVVQDAASKAIERLKSNCAPQGIFSLEEIKVLRADKLLLESGIEFKCPVFEDMLAGCTHLISFIITLGKETDIKIASYSKDVQEPLASLFMETASRLCLELVMRDARIQLTQFAVMNDMKLGSRMAPGNSYKVKSANHRIMWDLDQQVELFNTFQHFEIPVELLESCTMLPRMSRSGIYGLKKTK